MPRFVDADLLINAINDVDIITDTAKFIRDFPTADVVERKVGKLLNANPVGECSVCGWLIDYRDGFNYCPNCGADMRERREE